MGRTAGTIRALVALTLLAAANPSFPGEDAGGKRARPSAGKLPRGKTAYSLGEVKILGSAEHPGVLFFLPRAKFRLLPYRPPEIDWKDRILRDDRGLEGE